jgi:predicted AAA+ superfamily ATPase
MADTGLLVSMLDDGTNAQIINGELGIYKGAIFENGISQMLALRGYSLYYYTRNNNLELDFVISSSGVPFLLEVKAGSKCSRSLRTILQEKPSLKGIKLTDGNIGVKDNLISLPLYMAMFL